MVFHHALVAPSLGAEPVEVHERAELADLEEHPDGVFVEVMGYEVARVGVAKNNLKSILSPIKFGAKGHSSCHV